MYYNFSKFYILKPKRNGKTKPTGTAGEHPAPRPRNKNRGGTCGTLGEGGKIFGTQKTDTTETAKKIILYFKHQKNASERAWHFKHSENAKRGNSQRVAGWTFSRQK